MEGQRSACERLLGDLAVALHAQCAVVELAPEGGTLPERLATYGPVDGAVDLTWLDLPVSGDSTEAARVRLGFCQGVALPDEEEWRVAETLVELAVWLSRLSWQRALLPAREASRRILAVTEEELQRIILDVHDGPVQKLFAASSQVELMQSQLAHMPDDVRAGLEGSLARVDNLLQSSLDEIKTALGTFRPPEFRRRPLVSVMQGLIMQHEALTGVRVELQVVGELPPVTLPVKIAAYRILQEALSNAHRHAGVDRLDVRLRGENGWVVLEVVDAGRGFEPPPLEGPSATEREEHIGLRGMRDRAQLVGGHMQLVSQPGRGTRIQVRVPGDV